MARAVKQEKPQFSNGTNEHVFQLLRKDVKQIVDQLTPERAWTIKAKAFLFPLLYLSLWLIALFFGKDQPWIYYSAFVGLGFMVVIIFLNIIHDAVHRTIFKSRKLNDLFVYLFDLMGANSFIWRIRHVRFHHNYPNVNGWDTDIEQTDIFRVFPNGPHSKWHKYQRYYLPLIYPLFLFNWMLIRDFRDFFNAKKIVRKHMQIPLNEFFKLFLFKGFFFFYLILLPKLMLGISWSQALGGFVVMIMTASVFSLFVLLPPHANTSASFPLPNEEDKLPENWFTHMLITTNDVQEDNAFIRFFMGSFNYHVAHHLFPNVNHVFYPEITEKLRVYAQAYHLPYRTFPLFKALQSHFELIKQNGRVDDFDIWEESM